MAYQAKAEMLIHSTAKSAFAAFVEPDLLVKFWLASSSAPLAPGTRARWDFLVPGASETVAVTVFDPPRHLAFDWSDAIDVDIRFAARDGDAVVVTVVASGFQASRM